MANITLMAYLQLGLPVIPINPPQRSSRNTTNTAYAARDIIRDGVWQNFDLNAVTNQYGPLLQQANLPANPLPTSPPPAVSSEKAVAARMDEYVFHRIRRALRAAFQSQHQSVQNLTTVSIGVGEAARVIEAFKPDIAFFDMAMPEGERPNRLPGDIKPSWKWSSALGVAAGTERDEYLQALSQVNWYMKQHRARYGYILTNRELVAFRRLDDDGNLEIAAPIPYDLAGSATPPYQFTLLMALWYLGMLAAQDNHSNGVLRWYM